MATASAAKADANPAPNPDWAQIGKDYFKLIQLHRKQEDATLNTYFVQQADKLKLHLKYNGLIRNLLLGEYVERAGEGEERCKLLRCVQVLRDEYEAGQAKLAELDTEVKAAWEARRIEQVREDEVCRAFFQMYQEDGLAYQPQKEGPKPQDERAEVTLGAVDAAGAGAGAGGEGEKQGQAQAPAYAGKKGSGTEPGSSSKNTAVPRPPKREYCHSTPGPPKPKKITIKVIAKNAPGSEAAPPHKKARIVLNRAGCRTARPKTTTPGSGIHRPTRAAAWTGESKSSV